MGHVYLITNDYNHYKIGVTKGDVSKRIRQLQTGNSERIELVNSYESDNYNHIERWLHRKLFIKRLEGEWFELTESEVLDFKSNCDRIDEIVKVLKKENPFFK